ncbi:MAG: cysteine--1-D-myo-inosityl 2-amino-2-deoxy-alpha-D-glucopyranoside ligase [Myxococcales bacterium]|nr:MAG: cysteine--1-D-myo-inosityl 2-amino-2-deoxy-alpha-D-glucopyranoside ligase [Myxococcales bacterium]
MHAWPAPDVPTLPVPAPPVRVMSTPVGAVDVTPAAGPATLYVCGITPYDATHMGHAATYVAFDLLNRAWRAAGHTVRYVQNVTDVDDPLLERATAIGVDWAELAVRETDLFRSDMTALRVLPPDEYIGAVEAIPLVVEMIQRLQQQGAVYDVDGDLYFDVHADPDFGAVSGWTRDKMLEIFGERGGDPDRAGKRDPLDCLLWQTERPDDPAWDSPLGRGRPGWHIECSAIARTYLGAGIDVQGGGSDLVFPHHEMSASEGHVADPGIPFARAYVHAGMVAYDGEKMSKSKGNLVLVSKLRRQAVDPMAIRLALLAHHYRTDWEWTDEVLVTAAGRLSAWREAVAKGAGAPTDAARTAVLAAIADDLDAPAALDAIDAWAAATNAGDTAEPDAGASISTLVDAVLGVRVAG